jgi:hypothetical protein
MVMYDYISIIFYRYTNHDCVSHTLELTTGMNVTLPPNIHTPTIFGKLFLLVRAYRTGMFHGIT